MMDEDPQALRTSDINPIFSLSDLVDDLPEEAEADDFLKACNTKSKIIKLSKKTGGAKKEK